MKHIHNENVCRQERDIQTTHKSTNAAYYDISVVLTTINEDSSNIDTINIHIIKINDQTVLQKREKNRTRPYTSGLFYKKDPLTRTKITSCQALYGCTCQ